MPKYKHFNIIRRKILCVNLCAFARLYVLFCIIVIDFHNITLVCAVCIFFFFFFERQNTYFRKYNNYFQLIVQRRVIDTYMVESGYITVIIKTYRYINNCPFSNLQRAPAECDILVSWSPRIYYK